MNEWTNKQTIDLVKQINDDRENNINKWANEQTNEW